MKWPPSEKVLWVATLAVFVALLAFAQMRRADLLEAIVSGEIKDATPALSGDAASYYRLASKTPFPCFTTEREPGILVVGRVALAVGGNPGAGVSADTTDETARRRLLESHAVLRHASIGLSLLAMAALFGLALLVAGRCGALLAAFLWADAPWLQFYGIGFLREDLAATFLFALLAALVALFRLPADRRRARILLASAAALAGALLALSRLEGLGTAILLVAAWAASRAASKRFSRADALTAASIAAGVFLLVSPYLVYNSVQAGSALAPMRAHSRFWRNHEFAGQPGFPTRAEVLKDSYCGPPETPFHYVFGLHSIPAVAGRYAAGLWSGFTHQLSRLLPGREWIAWIVPLGLFGLAWRRRWEGAFLAAAGVIALLPYAFILTLDTVLTPNPADHAGVEPRFALPVLWFAILWIASGLGAAVSWWQTRREAAGAVAGD